MTLLISLAKLIGGPGSLRLLGVLVTLGVIWIFVWPRWPRSGLYGIAGVIVAYAVMALPIVATAITDALPPAPAPGEAELRGVQTLFIFDGDNRWGRLREFAAIEDLAKPRRVVLLGRLSVYKDLRLMGVPTERLRQDSTSYNTTTQVARVAALIAGDGSDHAAILTSRLQFPRVQAFVRRRGLNVLVVPSPLDVTPPTRGAGRFLPSLAALAVSRDAVYELAALRYYDVEEPAPER